MAHDDVNKRRAYLYQAVIELLFSPSTEKERKQWIHAFLGSLVSFWQTYTLNPYTIKNGQYEITPNLLGIECFCSCDIRENNYFAIQFTVFKDGLNEPFTWAHHVDPRYFRVPLKAFLGEHNSVKTKALAEADEEDIAAILDTLVFHPCEHIHMESCIPDHEIRFGGGISNPFQYLFHLRYQFCPIPKVREAEKQRLKDLVYRALQSKSRSIDIKTLMEIPETD
ncbi:MAG: hypothetical protein ACR2PX_02810 [Endozoicomonas sp.]|uniref:hypothetical protein n=1 Tax=Endozoicomonas sp. TaxID=1892382 RepID=UPI003D9AD25E